MLAQVKAEPALNSRRLSGAGVRIAVEDDFVDFRSPQLAGQVETNPARGARFTYHHPLSSTNPVAPCDGVSCTVLEVDDIGDVEERARQSILADGYPTDVASRYIRVTSSPSWLSWYKIPGVSDTKRTHGTAVASVIIGKDGGVAPGARVIPWPIPLGDDPEVQDARIADARDLEETVNRLGPTHNSVVALDRSMGQLELLYNSNVDIVNRSYGIPIISDTGRGFSDRTAAVAWAWLGNNLPHYWGALLQNGVPEDEKTLFVASAGNLLPGVLDPPRFPEAAASMAWWFPQLRGLHFAVVGVRADGSLHPRSIPCGTLPIDWNALTQGRHYCLGAPFTVNGAKTGTNPDPALSPISGTSFSAPMVAGALALVMEKFRGTLNPREVGRRLVDTADNTVAGYDAAKIGAGVLDIDAATSPVGQLQITARAGGQPYPVRSTNLVTSTSYGDSVSRVVERIEIAGFDALNAPFWYEMSGFVSQAPRSAVPRIPHARSETVRDTSLPAGLAWASVGTLEALPDHALRLVMPTSSGSVLAGLSHASGLELVPQNHGFGMGFLHETEGVQGGQASGAFGTQAEATTVWLKRQDRWELARQEESWRVGTEMVLGAGRPKVAAGAIFEPGSGMFSSAKVALVRSTAGGATTEFSLSQPWRAESGSANLTYPISRTTDGARVYERRTIGLSPAGREIAVGLRHDRPLLAGEATVSIGYSHDAGHVQGEEDLRGGIAYRMSW